MLFSQTKVDSVTYIFEIIVFSHTDIASGDQCRDISDGSSSFVERILNKNRQVYYGTIAIL